MSIVYSTALCAAYFAGLAFLRRQGARWRVPWVTLALVIVLAALAAVQSLWPPLLPLLERDAGRIARGEWWRVVTSLGVQDGGVPGTAFNLLALATLGGIAEQLWSGAPLALLFFGGAITGELAGLAWQPIGAGNSVGNFGVAAAIAVACLTRRAPPTAWLFATLCLATGAVLAALHDVHGAATLGGAALALVLGRRERRAISPRA